MLASTELKEAEVKKNIVTWLSASGKRRDLLNVSAFNQWALSTMSFPTLIGQYHTAHRKHVTVRFIKSMEASRNKIRN